MNRVLFCKGTACKTNARKSAWGTVWKTDVGKGAWGTVWKTDVGKSDWGTAWKTNAGKSDWGTVWKTAEKVTEKVLFQGHNVTSLKLKRRQCRLQLGTAINLVLHICCGLKYDSSSNIHHRQQLIKFCHSQLHPAFHFHFHWNYRMLCRILINCRDL